MTDDQEPRCSRCGAEVTTGFMAAICPHREKCEFWPDDAESQEFLDSLGWRLPMDGRSALRFWRAHKDALLALAASDGRGDTP